MEDILINAFFNFIFNPFIWSLGIFCFCVKFIYYMVELLIPDEKNIIEKEKIENFGEEE